MKTQDGFTLIETLLYMALFGIIIGGFAVTAHNLIQGSGKTTALALAQKEGNFILRKIDWALTGVKTINIPAAGASGAILTVTKYDASVLTFDMNSGNMRLQRGTGIPMALNSGNVTVAGVVFDHSAAANGIPEKIKADFTVNGKPFTLTKYLRK